MAERNTYFEFLGFATIAGIAIALCLAIQSSLLDSRVLGLMNELSPWLAEHSPFLGLMSCAVVLVASVVLPPVLMRAELRDGQSRLAALGLFVFGVMLVPSIGYLLAVGWFGFRIASGS